MAGPPDGGTRGSLAGMVAMLTKPFRSGSKNQTNTQSDLTQFNPIFLPDSGNFSPGQPLVPPQREPLRAWNYPFAWNTTYTPRSWENVSFEELRALAESHDITRLAIETRKDQIEKLGWQIVPKDTDIVAADAPDRADKLQDFFQHPDGLQSFASWLRELLEDLLVLDAPTLEVRRNRANEIIGLDVIDGSSIKPLLDYNGRTPRPPAPAFEQIIHGRPWALIQDGQRTNDENPDDPILFTDSELIYLPRNRRPHKAYGFCYSGDVEILTRRGWLCFSEVTTSDEVATRNIASKAFEWQHPTHIVAQPYCGPMLHFHSTSMDLLVTPEHRMLVTSTPRALHHKITTPFNLRARAWTAKWRENERRKSLGLPLLPNRNKGLRDNETIISARALADNLNHEIKIPMTSVWSGVEIERKSFALPEPVGNIEVTRRLANGTIQTFTRRRHRGDERPLTISGDDYCALMGAYLAEGNLRSQGGIEINQRESSKGYGPYGSLISRITGAPAAHNGKAFVVARKGLTEHFRGFGHAHEKYVPTEIMDATTKQIRLFWDHYCLGDGSFEPRKNASRRGGNRDHSTRITTVSKHLADQLVELAQKLGWSASVRKRSTAGKATICGRECNIRDSYVVSVRYSEAMGIKVSEVPYDGMVHCVTVPNGIVYVRRNGKPAWCGNSPVEQILITVNIGLRRQISQLNEFTDGNMPPGLITAPSSWNPDQIENMQQWWDTMLSGNLANKRRLMWGPDGAKYQRFFEAPIKDDFDEWLARIVCFAFSLPPTPFTKMQNRGEQEASKEASLEEGLAPLMSWVKRLIDGIIQRRMGHKDLEFVWSDERPVDPETKSKITDMKLHSGRMTLNEARDEDGLDPVDGGDHVMFFTPSGPLLLSAVVGGTGYPRELIDNPPNDPADKDNTIDEQQGATADEGTAAPDPPHPGQPGDDANPRTDPNAGDNSDTGPNKNKNARAKLNQNAASYTDYGHGDRRCRNCTMFRAPDRCTLVAGDIHPEGSCKYFEAFEEAPAGKAAVPFSRRARLATAPARNAALMHRTEQHLKQKLSGFFGDRAKHVAAQVAKELGLT